MTIPEPDLINTVASVSKLYVLAALEDMESAGRAFLNEIARLRAKYTTELTGPDAFTLLCQATERLPRATSNPHTTTGRFRTDDTGLPRMP